MQQFNLDTWLQDKSRKVVTRTGEPVEIIDYKAKGEYCVYAKATWQDGETFNICTTSNGEAYKGEKTAYDLFFADEENTEMTEFEARIYNLINFSDQDNYPSIKEVKEEAEILFELAREEILKNLPKWKKAKKNEKPECRVAIQQDDRVVLSDFVQKDEYYITLGVLKKLPKEE